MGRIVRMLLMFGPMIFRQYQKWQRSREKDTQQNTPRVNREVMGDKDYRDTQAAPRGPKDNEFV